MIHNRSAKKYLCRVHSMLPCSRKMKKHILEQIRNEIFLFLEEQPKADYTTLVSRFGAPEAIAASYVDYANAPEVLKKIRIRKQILSVVATILVLGILIWTSAVIIEAIRYEKDYSGHVEVVFEES